MPCPDGCGALALQLALFGLTNGAVVALNAVGFTLAYGVARQINLAHGNVFALTTVLVASLARALGVTVATPASERIGIVLLLTLSGAICGAGLNVVVERLAFRPFWRGRDPMAPLIATVGLSFFLLQVAVWWYATYNVPRPGHQGVNLPLLAMPDLLPAVELGGFGVSFTLKDALVLLLAASAAAGLALLLAKSRMGRLLRAVAQDAEMATLCGADARRAQTLAFALAGALAGFGAAIFATYYGGTSAQHGLRSGLTAMAAAVLGGVGDPRGALVGGVALGILSSFGDYFLDAQWTPVLVLLLLVGLLAFRPQGLLVGGGIVGSEDVPSPTPATVAGRSLPGARWLLGGLLILALLYPMADQLAGWQRLYSAATTLLLVTLAIGLGIVVGFAGLVDLGYAAFFAIGGYTAAILTSSGSRLAADLPPLTREPWLALPLAGLVAATFGIVFGLPSVRTRGEYLAIVTLAFGEIVPGVILHLPHVTGGPRGMTGIPSPSLGPWAPDSPVHAYAIALALATVACLAALRLVRSRTGRSWAAVRDDELAARTIGVDATGAKLLAFAIGAAYAGIAGAVYAGLLGHIEPEQFDLTLSLMVLAAVVIGGRWGITGVVLGALVVAAYDRVLVDALTTILRGLGGLTGLAFLQGADLRGHNFAIFGIALYLAIRWRAGADAGSASAPRSSRIGKGLTPTIIRVR
jgi:branched-chain amino acid transport system permease protein